MTLPSKSNRDSGRPDRLDERSDREPVPAWQVQAPAPDKPLRDPAAAARRIVHKYAYALRRLADG